LLAIVLAVFAQAAQAGTIRLPDVPDGSLGVYADYLVEGAQPLNLEQAMAQYGSGKFQPGRQAALNFGIGSRPVWVHLAVDNSTAVDFKEYLVGGVTWLDRMDVYVVRSGQLQDEVHTGDELRYSPGLTPALGYALPLYFSPGSTDVFLRVDSTDPMVLPLELMSGDQLAERKLHSGYYYGLFYGFLIALFAYNLLLFAGLKERSYLYYSLALLGAILCNLSYTGHGVAWLWPQLPWLQRYVILVFMVLFGIAGLVFAGRFLSLAEHAPRIHKAVKWFCGIGLGALALLVLSNRHLEAALLAFVFVALFTVGMFLLGILAVYQGRAAGRYFLVATFFGLLGVASTDLAVWGKIPFTSLTFHAMEAGVAVEATLLALALAYTMRGYKKAKVAARQDHLTGLNNRRAFMELATPPWSSAERSERPLSLIMMDIDNFKQINDQYGHKAGDDVLVAIAGLLKQYGRTSDIAARWGGEEFVLLLTETNVNQAASYAERLREAITELQVFCGDNRIPLTASFGVAQRNPKSTLEGMIQLADVQLYRAKEEGRNRVCYSDLGAARIVA
jgi:diguanylate cyclase (GGDEF)-like protein